MPDRPGLKPFSDIYQRALGRFPDEAQMLRQLPVPATAGQLCATGDDRYLSQLCLRVFRAGLRHSMVDARWPRFESVFHGFVPAAVAAMSDEQLEWAMAQEGIIRHWRKLQAVRTNAFMVMQLSLECGGFGAWLASWPVEEITGLWRELARRGAQLGGHSGPAFLRMVGKDTFLLTDDVVAALAAQGIIDARPASARSLQAVQDVFNGWRRESGLPLCQISRILSLTR